MFWCCLMCILGLWFTWIASSRDIPSGISPFRGMGRLSKARSRSSWLMFIQSGIPWPLKNWWIGPGPAVGNCPAGISWSMKSRWSSLIRQSPFRDLHCCHWTADVEHLVLFRTDHHKYASISSTISSKISSTLLRTLQSQALSHLRYRRFWLWYRRKTFDIGYDIKFRRSLYTRYVFDIEVFIRYRVQYRIAISGYKDIEVKNFDVVHDIGKMSGYKDIDEFSSIPKIWSILGTIWHTWGGWAHQPRRRYTGSPGPADGSNWGLSCRSSAAFCCCSGPGLPAGHGGQSWCQVIAVLVSWWWFTWCQSSMLSACHWNSA